MDIYPASWDILNKIFNKHKLEFSEVEEIFSNKPKIFKILASDQYGQTRYKAFGNTDSGKYITVVFIKEECNIKVITARKMTEKEKSKFKGSK